MEYVKNDREAFRAQYMALWDASLRISQGYVVVIDRHWLSELIYARVYRFGSLLSDEARMWDRVMMRLGAVQILCAPPVEFAVESHKVEASRREEMYKPSPKIAEVAKLYRSLYFNDGDGDDYQEQATDYALQLIESGTYHERDDTMLYDRSTQGGMMDVCASIAYKKLISRRATQLPSLLEHGRPNGLGHPQDAKFLFVGDCVNPNKSGRYPFVDYGSSSGFLSSALASLEFDETHGMWTNANDPWNIIEEALARKPLKVIALGKAAEAKLKAMEYDNYASVIHPSCAKRFGRRTVLVEQLKEALK